MVRYADFTVGQTFSFYVNRKTVLRRTPTTGTDHINSLGKQIRSPTTSPLDNKR